MPLRPRSLLQLLLAGFVLTTLPLAVALATAVIYLDRVTEHGREAVVAAAEYMRTSQQLVDQTTSLERFARQYHVLGDTAFLELYRDRFAEVGLTLTRLRAVARDTAPVDEIDRYAGVLRDVNSTFHALPAGSAETHRVVEGFRLLGERARAVRNLGFQQVGDSTRRLQDASELADRLLFWQAAALLPAVLLVATGCVYLVLRPLRQLDHGIRRLGRGEFHEPISVRGPDDVESLGQTLDWTRQRLEALEEQKTAFLRQISHELKTPLTTLREGAALLRDGTAGPLSDGQQEIVNVLLENSRRLQRLIENLLDYNRLQTPIQLDRQAEVPLNALLDEVLENHSMSLRRRNLQVQREGPPLSVPGDPEKLRTVIDNLLSNAVKYSPRGTVVTIATRAEEGRAVLEIRDAGPGVDDEEREAIFEPFVQGRARARGHVKGTGLGLAIARRFALLHGGELRLAPNPAEQGACFRLELPMDRPEESRA